MRKEEIENELRKEEIENELRKCSRMIREMEEDFDNQVEEKYRSWNYCMLRIARDFAQKIYCLQKRISHLEIEYKKSQQIILI